jgi:cytochrome P450
MTPTPPPTQTPASTPRRFEDLPGPRGWPVVGNALQVERTHIHQDVEAWARQYGPVFRMHLGRRPVLVVSDHEVIAGVMRDRPEGFRRPATLETVVRELGNAPGVFVAEGEQWHRQRRMVMAAFSPTHVRAYFPALVRVAARLRGRWLKAAQAGQTIDLQSDLMRFTVDVITGLAFGVETNTLESEGDVIQQHMDKIFPALFKRLNAVVPTWRWFKTEEDRQLERSMAVVGAAIDDFIAQARSRLTTDPARRAQPANLIEAMIVAADEPDSGMSDADVAGNMFTMLLAGEDTTANTLAWMIYLLSRQPQALVRATEEARRVMTDLSTFTMDQVADLPYLEACTQETMRLKPVAPFRMQQALRDMTVAGVSITKGTMVWCVSRHDTYSEAYFPNHEKFEPARWLDEGAHAPGSVPMSSAKRVSNPFGAGPRVCPGRYLAMVEMKLALAMLLREFDIESLDTPDGAEAQEVMNFTMTPVGLRMRLRPAAGRV